MYLYVWKSGHYIIHHAEHDGVDKANASHANQTKQEKVGIPVQLKVSGFGVQDGPD